MNAPKRWPNVVLSERQWERVLAKLGNDASSLDEQLCKSIRDQIAGRT